MSNGLLDTVVEQVLNRTPLQRLGGSEDLKGAVVFLASERASYITGTAIAVDGGRTRNLL